MLFLPARGPERHRRGPGARCRAAWLCALLLGGLPGARAGAAGPRDVPRLAPANVHIPAEPLTARIESAPASATGADPLLVQFTAVTTGGWPPTKFVWDFGDGTPLDLREKPLHRYAAGGSYAVTLIATDSGEPENDAVAHQRVDVRLPDPEPPRLLLHIQPAGPEGDACRPGVGAAVDAVVAGQLSAAGAGDQYLYLLVDRHAAPGVAGLLCGITYGDGSSLARGDGLGIDVLSWHLCADFELVMPGTNPWPNAGSGITIVWDSIQHCQTGPLAVAGYFVVRPASTDVVSLIPRPGEALAVVTDCAAREYRLGADQLGAVTFSPGATLPGYNPAIPGGPGHAVPVRSTTWGGIKAQYGGR